MCGIYGYISRSTPIDLEAREARVRMLAHRGPDNISFFHKKNIFLGHVRLSIIDLATTANQPFRDNKYCLIYNGEIYNYLQLKNDHLINKHLHTKSDTEVLFELLKKEGTKSLRLLNGMFAFAFYDEDKCELLLARDTVGIKPLYFVASADSFEFSSEIKNLDFKIDVNSLKNVIAYGRFEYNYLPYENVKILEPGQMLVLNLNTLKYQLKSYQNIKNYINTEIYQLQSRTPNLVDRLDSLLNDSVLLHLQSDAPVGVLCSGGLDSSLISALSLKHKKNLKLYHAGVEGGKGEESYALMVSKHLKVPIEFIKMSKDEYWTVFPTVTYYSDLPIYHPNDISLFSISQKAHSDGIKVLLAGEGADELFGGYSWHQYFKQMLVKYDKDPCNSPLLKRIKNKISKYLFYNNSFPDFSKDDFINYSALGIGYGGHVPEWQIRSNAVLAQNFRAWDHWLSIIDSYRQCTDDKNDAYLLSFIMNNLYGHLSTILHRTDRILMLTSIEGRVPFLENSLFEFSLNLPSTWKIRGKEGKFILKKVAERYLPRAVVYRTKVGFPVPWQDYLPANPSILHSGFIADWMSLDIKSLRALYNSNDTLKFRLLALEVWARIFILKEKPQQIKVM